MTIMRMRKKFALLIGIFTLLFLIYLYFQNNPRNTDKIAQITSDSSQSTHPLKFFDEDLFYQGVIEAEKQNQRLSYVVKGGIVPHHLLPSYMLAVFFKRLSAQQPKIVILLGPNHYERGDFKVLTSRYGWITPFGTLETSSITVDALTQQKLAEIDEETLEEEHSVAGIMPFIKYYLPTAKVVPIILSSTIEQIKAQTLAERLADFVQREDAVVVAAVDFSHYLTSTEAEKRDKKTLQLMQNYDYDKLFKLTNEYLDSPAAIAIILMTMQELGTTNSEILHNTNSGKLLQNKTSETTSYFSVVFN